ncbi:MULTISPECIES: hypothetical protein [Alphaproteobacteria]|uniref:Surface antigen n=2 Tax=Alphaproteobacteria TaxID=28211 RepID=A0A512HG08_9HYPH|nr:MULTISPECIES: hypothetical protein [Alphaproteobacteria]GEO84393.1 outer-hypothetical protein [Ciceribacter naphthalenivorans]GLR22356.1 outer-hypothetical protein [Ciceribacter naphthalenivorans]GLT05212.1 outer-hypothetical protein [Sphingomonas psychrolutea]
MSVSRFGGAAALMLAALALSACTTTGGSKGGFLSSGKANPSALYISALQGGIVSRSGLKLTDSELQRALEAEYRALEAAPGGQPVAWTGQSVSGQVVAAAPYQVGQQNCRQYTHKLNAKGRQIEARGAACRNSNGTWTPLT